MKSLQSLPTIREFRAQLKRKTAGTALSHNFEQCSCHGCWLQGLKCPTEQKSQPWLNRALGDLLSDVFFPASETRWNLRTFLGGQTNQTIPLMPSISTALCTTELKLQGLSLINCRKIFACSLTHGRTVRRFWRTSIISWFGFILSCNMGGLQHHVETTSEPQLIANIEAACSIGQHFQTRYFGGDWETIRNNTWVRPCN